MTKQFLLLTISFLCSSLFAGRQLSAQSNTQTGTEALLSNTTGTNNTATGFRALRDNNSGSGNSAHGSISLTFNKSGNYNTATGFSALFTNSNGNNNSAHGAFALYKNVSGNQNTANGVNALYNNTGNANTATGYNALFYNTTGFFNTATGMNALYYNAGSENTAVGYEALYSNEDAIDNTALGTYALRSNSKGKWNTATGISTLKENVDGNWNTANGGFALQNNKKGIANTAMGFSALNEIPAGSYNTAVGNHSMRYYPVSVAFTGVADDKNTAIGADALLTGRGSENTAIGYSAASTLLPGNRTTALGSFAGYIGGPVLGNPLDDNTLLGSYIRLGHPLFGFGPIFNSTALGHGTLLTASNQIVIGNIDVTEIKGQVNMTTFSDGRFKKDLREDVPGLTFINQLRPITYSLDINRLAEKLDENYQPAGADAIQKVSRQQLSAEAQKARAEKARIRYTGFVAQEVYENAKKLNYDFSGVDVPKNKDGLYGLRYSEFVVPLVKAVQELSKENDEIRKENKALRDELSELKQMVLKLANGQPVTIGTSSAYLEQNAPNPFSSATVIRYHLPANTGNAQLLITGINGQTLRSFTLRNGDSQLTLNAGTLAAGTYNYSLIVEGRKADSKQLVITR